MFERTSPKGDTIHDTNECLYLDRVFSFHPATQAGSEGGTKRPRERTEELNAVFKSHVNSG